MIKFSKGRFDWSKQRSHTSTHHQNRIHIAKTIEDEAYITHPCLLYSTQHLHQENKKNTVIIYTNKLKSLHLDFK